MVVFYGLVIYYDLQNYYYRLYKKERKKVIIPQIFNKKKLSFFKYKKSCEQKN